MSKTAQRKRQAYEEGLKHGYRAYGIAYRRHPFMEQYRNGYADGARRRKIVMATRKPGIIERAIFWIIQSFPGGYAK